MHGRIWCLVVATLCLYTWGSHATAGDPVGQCEDGDPKCPEWAKIGDCNRIPQNMNVLCRKSCNRCHLPFLCEDNHKSCKSWARAGECQKNPNYMRWFCRESCDTCNMEQKRATVREQQNEKVFRPRQAESFLPRDSLTEEEAPLPGKAPQSHGMWLWGVVFLGCVGVYALSRVFKQRKVKF